MVNKISKYLKQELIISNKGGILVEKLDMLYEGKAKRVFKTNKKDIYLIEYKDDATAFNGEKKGTIVGKSAINNKMSNIIFNMLEINSIPTHFIEEIDEIRTLVKSVQIIPLEVIIRNVAAGSFSKRFGVEEGTALNNPILEFSYKNDSLGDPMINDSQILALGLSSNDELKKIKELTRKINECLIRFFTDANLRLIDFKIEFGRCNGEVILADEISPDTCRLWDIDTNEKLDKDRFRRDLGKVEDAYQEVYRRIAK